MDILESLEVRWFLPPGVPAGAALDKWFASAPDEGERVDHYLATGRNDLGFKARLAKGKPAKVETKYLVGSLGVIDLSPNMSGELQRWTKLSLALDDPELQLHGAWLALAKTRRLRKFAVTMSQAPAAKEVSVDEYPPIGCGVELTRLEYAINGTTRVEWTFALESFGPKTQLLDVLQTTIRTITAPPGLPDLTGRVDGELRELVVIENRLSRQGQCSDCLVCPRQQFPVTVVGADEYAQVVEVLLRPLHFHRHDAGHDRVVSESWIALKHDETSAWTALRASRDPRKLG